MTALSARRSDTRNACRTRFGVADKVAPCEAVDAFACEGAALVVEAEAAIDAGQCLRVLE